MWKYTKNQMPHTYLEGWWDGKKSDELLFQDENNVYHLGVYYDDGQWFDNNDYEVNRKIIRFIELNQIENQFFNIQKHSDEYVPPFRVGKKQNRAVLDSRGHSVIVFPRDNGQAQLYCDYLNS